MQQYLSSCMGRFVGASIFVSALIPLLFMPAGPGLRRCVGRAPPRELYMSYSYVYYSSGYGGGT
jgi:hypothetical protein